MENINYVVRECLRTLEPLMDTMVFHGDHEYFGIVTKLFPNPPPEHIYLKECDLSPLVDTLPKHTKKDYILQTLAKRLSDRYNGGTYYCQVKYEITDNDGVLLCKIRRHMND